MDVINNTLKAAVRTKSKLKRISKTQPHFFPNSLLNNFIADKFSSILHFYSKLSVSGDVLYMDEPVLLFSSRVCLFSLVILCV